MEESSDRDPRDGVEALSPSILAERAAQRFAESREVSDVAAPRRRPPVAVVALVVVVAAVALVASLCAPPPAVDPLAPLPPPTSPEGDVLRDPFEDEPELWRFALDAELEGGSPLPLDELAEALSDPESSDLPEESFVAAAEVASEFLVARASGVVPAALQPMFSANAAPLAETVPSGETVPSAFCSDVEVLAASPRSAPTREGRFARALVLWTGSCPVPIDGGFAADVVSLEMVGGQWQPVWSLAPHVRPRGSLPGTPAAWELERFGECGDPANAEFSARVELVALFAEMCDAAAADGVELRVTSAYRSPVQQAELFSLALDRFGSPGAAGRWVAFADGVECSSRHCAGEAVDVDDTPAALRWLFATVGCADVASGEFVEGSSCESGAAVSRLESFGFSAPLASQPWHLEVGLPLALLSADAPAGCDPPRSQSVPQMIVSIFRCRLLSAGVSPAVADVAAGDAVLVARCASGWNPAFVAFGGRFRSSPNPSDGRLYDSEGVFALSAATADRVVRGGSAQLSDAVANIDGAASLWLADAPSGDGFAAFPCAELLPAERPDWLAALLSQRPLE